MQKQSSLFSLIREDFAVVKTRDPALQSSFELLFNYPGLIALVHYRIAHWLYMRGFKKLGRAISGITLFLTNVDIHPEAKIGRRVFIDHAIGVVIGQTAVVGDDVTIYQGVSLGGVSLARTKRHPTIESGVVIGAGAKVLGDIVVGENAKIGANSVVIKDVPRDCTAVGIPARVIVKGRSKEADAANKLPDIDRVLFQYLLTRMKILEKNTQLPQQCVKELEELEVLYKDFLESCNH
ncbi:serine O-acetyltransferase [Helicobacter sp. 10-6591]|uniref:serine O-acetyltransferase n=1 Tax=Helicobacter sp. 10-6591 TaxID=2004998 RepID=UPI000DCBBEB8|nr:serine O-acetyltransferase [Helicobacter sp. 10-6591]MCI7485080.1 serine O-acetyltransferase [Helicobacter sp.]RAX55782.1 serine O-acetyltransferase [Helicobacter sp. 10-6591]